MASDFHQQFLFHPSVAISPVMKDLICQHFSYVGVFKDLLFMMCWLHLYKSRHCRNVWYLFLFFYYYSGILMKMCTTAFACTTQLEVLKVACFTAEIAVIYWSINFNDRIHLLWVLPKNLPEFPVKRRSVAKDGHHADYHKKSPAVNLCAWEDLLFSWGLVW